MSRVAVSGRSAWLNSARYGSENRRCWVMSTASSGSPSGAVRPVMTPTGSTLGTSRRPSCRSSSYSRYATVSPISLIATTRPDSRANRTVCREMPRGRAARRSAGQSASGTSQGRSSRAGSGAAAVICRRVRGVMGRFSHQDDEGAGPVRAGPAPTAWRCGASVRDALARAGVEQVLLAGADADVDGLALGRDLPRVDAHDDLRVAGARVDVRRAGLADERAVHERVGAELLDDVDRHRDRVRGALRDDVQRLRAEPDGDGVVVVRRELAARVARDLDAGRADLRDAVRDRERADVHGRGADEAGDEHVGRGVVHVARGADLLEQAVLE